MSFRSVPPAGGEKDRARRSADRCDHSFGEFGPGPSRGHATWPIEASTAAGLCIPETSWVIRWADHPLVSGMAGLAREVGWVVFSPSRRDNTTAIAPAVR